MSVNESCTSIECSMPPLQLVGVATGRVEAVEVEQVLEGRHRLLDDAPERPARRG